MEQIELVLFCPKPLEKLSLDSTLNLTQLYLMACRVQESIGLEKNPTRLFIAKCLYFYVQKSILMIHEVLMWYPTVLPYREDKTYDRSDALITVIVHILMNTKYDMDKSELRGRSLLSKLRYEYHFEPFKPKAEEVVNVLIEKLKSNKSYNLYQAFCLLCKRLGVQHTQNVILLQYLLPLAQEYYCLALKTNEFDDSIAILLEVISMVLKPFPSNTDVKTYLNEFSRFLNSIERTIIQEAALCAILRLQRFGVDNCYNSLRHFQPNFELKTSTQAMLKTFLYRRTLTFWKTKTSENSVRYLK
ncbi:hypothetical protein DOY81_010367 [Sarcophaga bullata]|nr:hypothetical protein DOY81_010367 [Sarcophaga bullata]